MVSELVVSQLRSDCPNIVRNASADAPACHGLPLRGTSEVGCASHDVPAAGQAYDLRLTQTQLVILPRLAMLCWLHDVFNNSVAVATLSGKTTKLSWGRTSARAARGRN